MEKQFVTYNIAISLKNLRFNELCFGYFVLETKELICDKWGEHPNESSWTINAPLWQQAIDWLRVKHKIIVRDNLSINSTTSYNPSEKYFKWVVINCFERGTRNGEEYFVLNKDYNTYEEAREQAILNALKLIKNEK